MNASQGENEKKTNLPAYIKAGYIHRQASNFSEDSKISPRWFLVCGSDSPRDILSEVASLLSQKETQDMTTRRMQGPYT